MEAYLDITRKVQKSAMKYSLITLCLLCAMALLPPAGIAAEAQEADTASPPPAASDEGSSSAQFWQYDVPFKKPEADTPAPSANATLAVAPPPPVVVPAKNMEVAGRYTLGLIMHAPADLDDAEINAVVLAAQTKWKTPQVQVAWYAAGKKQGQGILAMGETKDGKNVTVTRPKDAAESMWLERTLCFPITPGELSGAYLENEVTADEDFQGKTVLFQSVIADIAKGAFNKPYVFFPSNEGSVTGLTCYFPSKDPNLRKIRKGAVVLVRGTVKGFLMQDVILEDCDVLSVQD